MRSAIVLSFGNHPGLHFSRTDSPPPIPCSIEIPCPPLTSSHYWMSNLLQGFVIACPSFLLVGISPADSRLCKGLARHHMCLCKGTRVPFSFHSLFILWLSVLKGCVASRVRALGKGPPVHHFFGSRPQSRDRRTVLFRRSLLLGRSKCGLSAVGHAP